MEEILKKILQKIDGVDSRLNNLEENFKGLRQDVNDLRQGQNELRQAQGELKLMLSANREATEKTYAELVSFRNETNEKFKHVERQNLFFDNDLNELNKKVAVHEREINKLKYDVNS